jgi:regulator of protease activity HflC (stomatin/prohibitin superfamily)
MHPLEIIPGVKVVRPTEMAVIENKGSHESTVGEGIHFVMPFIKQMRKINTTEQLADVGKNEMITQDNLNATVDLQVYYRVKANKKDVEKAMYEVDDYDYQIIQLGQTTARNVIGDMDFEKVNSDRQELNASLKKELEQQTNGWGIEVVRVELQEITPPTDVQKSMNSIVQAENKKDAAEDLAKAEETEAEGAKQAAIKEAEGQKQAAILEADGKAEAIMKEAKARAEEIKIVNSSINQHFIDKAQTYKQLETAEKGLKRNTKFFFDKDTDIPMLFTGAMDDVSPITDDDFDEENAEDIDFDIGSEVSEAAQEMKEQAKQEAQEMKEEADK